MKMKELIAKIERAGFEFDPDLIANEDEIYWADNVYAVQNEFGLICFILADLLQDALDIAADTGNLDCQKMSAEDFTEYNDNGWHDSYILAGNASEPFWSEYLNIQELT